VKNTFLNGELSDDVYMRSSLGYSILEGMICHLRHSLYGLKQAPRARFQHFASVVIAAGFPPVLMIRLSLFTCHLVVGLFSFFMWTT
jgi:hypothetical protein